MILISKHQFLCFQYVSILYSINLQKTSEPLNLIQILLNLSYKREYCKEFEFPVKKSLY